MNYLYLVIYVLFGVLPSLVWLWYYLQKDLHPEPKGMIVKVFFWGVLITLPVFVIEKTLSSLLVFLPGPPLLIGAVMWLVVIALPEETLKYLVVRSVVLPSKELDEPLDVMLYMVVAALGFAAMENILYLFTPATHLSFTLLVEETFTLSFIRFIGATFLHTLCSALVGYFVVVAAFTGKNRRVLVSLGIGLAALLHGLYDFSIITLSTPWSILIPALVIIGLATFVFYDFDEVNKVKAICKLS